MTWVITIEDPRRQDIVGLLEAHLAFARGESPSEHVHALDLDGLIHPAVTFCTGRHGDGTLLGVGALRFLEPGRAEIKSMHTAAVARGRGVGRQMVAHLIGLAEAAGVTWLGLETGTVEAFAPARRLYGSMGFEPCEPFGNYTVNPWSVCMSRILAEARGQGPRS